MSGHHISDKENAFVVVNITPDICLVHGKIVSYDIHRDLTHELSYEHSVHARGKPVLKIGSKIRGVESDNGKGIVSHVSLEAGNNLAVWGSVTVRIGKKPVCRHGDFVLMNGE